MSRRNDVAERVDAWMAWQDDEERFCAEAGIASPFIAAFCDRRALFDYWYRCLQLDVIADWKALMKRK